MPKSSMRTLENHIFDMDEYIQKIKELSIQNKYLKWYCNIIENSLLRNIIYENFEIHHIVPDSFFINSDRKRKFGFLEVNPNSELNLVKLTLREHFICHHLLTKIFNIRILKSKMNFAFYFMTKLPKYKIYEFINPEGKLIKIQNLTKFCKENNLLFHSMLDLYNEKQKSHRGYRNINYPNYNPKRIKF